MNEIAEKLSRSILGGKALASSAREMKDLIVRKANSATANEYFKRRYISLRLDLPRSIFQSAFRAADQLDKIVEDGLDILNEEAFQYLLEEGKKHFPFRNEFFDLSFNFFLERRQISTFYSDHYRAIKEKRPPPPILVETFFFSLALLEKSLGLSLRYRETLSFRIEEKVFLLQEEAIEEVFSLKEEEIPLIYQIQKKNQRLMEWLKTLRKFEEEEKKVKQRTWQAWL